MLRGTGHVSMNTVEQYMTSQGLSKHVSAYPIPMTLQLDLLLAGILYMYLEIPFPLYLVRVGEGNCL